MTCLFVQIRCRPGTAYQVADEICLREIHSELYSVSGEYDLLMKVYVPDGEDIGRFINDNLLQIDGIERTYTTQTYKAF
ncbi:MAG: AsnC family transcriptional regulator [Rhodobacterales bacterium]|nr:MAG: AsnC family transcriptional regulator [Rhodobacterales bacterium]